jgi:hypothetical protein
MRAIMYVNVKYLGRTRGQQHMTKCLDMAKGWWPECNFLVLPIYDKDTYVEFMKENVK